MANTDRPFGLKPVGHLLMGSFDGRVNIYYHSASDGTAIFRGDVVQSDETNTLTSALYPSVKQTAAAQTDNIGVAIGFGETPQLALRASNLNAVNYCPASTEMYIAVVDDPYVIFEVQEDSDGGALDAGASHGNADIVVGTGSTTTGTSAMELDSSDIKTATAQLRVLRIAPREDNAVGNYCKWLVMLNEHAYKTTTGT